MGPCLDGASLHLDTALRFKEAVWGPNLGTLYSRTGRGTETTLPLRVTVGDIAYLERCYLAKVTEGVRVLPFDYPLASLRTGLIYHLTFIPSSPNLAHCLHAYLILPSKYLLKSLIVAWHSSTRQD